MKGDCVDLTKMIPFEPTQRELSESPDEEIRATQVSSLLSEEEVDENDNHVTPNKLKRQNAMMMIPETPEPSVAHKKPRSLYYAEEELDSSEDNPDLAEYFATYNLKQTSIIAMCRTYANYLAASKKK